MSQNINTVDISNDANLEDYVLVSVNGSLRRVKVANLKELVDSTEDVVVVDTELSTTSVNPVQNRVITTELNKKANSSDMSTYQTKIDNTLTTTSKEVVGAINENANGISQLSGEKANKSEVNELKGDLSSVGQQADSNKEEIANLTSSVNEKFLSSGLGILRTGKLYGTKVWKSAVNNSQTLEKTYDNAGLVCVPSTDSTVGQDDYADIPLFQWVRCTYKRYDDGFAYPIAVESDSNYSEEGNVDCGSLMRTFYYKEIDNDDYTEVIISDSPNHALGLKPWEQAVRADGTVMPYFINSRYHSVVGTDGKLYSNRGRTSRNQFHNKKITN